MGWKIWGPRQREGAIAATFQRLRLHVPICKENRQSGNAPPAGFSNILAHVFSGRFHLTSAIAPSLCRSLKRSTHSQFYAAARRKGA